MYGQQVVGYMQHFTSDQTVEASPHVLYTQLDTKGSGYSVLIGLVKAWYFSFVVRDVVTCLYCVVELVLSYTCWTRKNNKRPIHTLRGFDCLSYAF